MLHIVKLSSNGDRTVTPINFLTDALKETNIKIAEICAHYAAVHCLEFSQDTLKCVWYGNSVGKILIANNPITKLTNRTASADQTDTPVQKTSISILGAIQLGT